MLVLFVVLQFINYKLIPFVNRMKVTSKWGEVTTESEKYNEKSVSGISIRR